MQVAGKGRRGRVWKIAVREQYLCMTILLCPDIPPVKAKPRRYTGHGDRRGRRYPGGDRLWRRKIERPNDIVVNGRKICGILDGDEYGDRLHQLMS
ncbi:MAG: hypothetical protein ACLU80_14885 [Dorea sp.]